MIHIEFPRPREGQSTRRLIISSHGSYADTGKGQVPGWEVNLVGHAWSLRVARHQVALWCHHLPVVMWLDGEGWTGIWKPWNHPGYVTPE